MKSHLKALVLSSLTLVTATISSVFAAQKDVLIDFGSSTAISPAYSSSLNIEGWNNITSGAAGTTIADLKDTYGNATGIGVSITDGFWNQVANSSNSNGTKTSTVYPATATQDSFFIGTLSGFLDSSASLHISGLQATKRYAVRLYASRITTDLTSDRTTLYTINGITKELQVRNNIDGVVEFTNLSASTGVLDLSIAMKAGSVFGYLGVMEIIENSLPTANAGSDKTITLPTSSVSLIGSGSDSDGTIVTYSWTKVSGGSATISSPSAATTTITGLAQGTYKFRLTVTDNNGATASDDVNVTVKAANLAPTVNAGVDASITLPTTSTTLSGTATDSDGTISSSVWSKISGGAAAITTPSALSTSVTGLTQGSYTFRLTATDNSGASTSDDVVITVNAAPNVAPTANAGSDKTITLPTTSVTLSGSGADSDGTITTYAWSKISGGSATIGSPSAASTSISGLAQGSYTFRLTVTDNSGAIATDDVNVTVNAATNTPPVANAGSDKLITLPSNSVTLSGAGTDSDGTISKYAWTKVAGGTATISSPSTASTSVNGLSQGSYTFRLTVTDSAGATGYDDLIVTVNAPPVANAGSDISIILPSNSVTLKGSATDADGTVSSYAWSQVSTLAATIKSPTSASTIVTNMVQGTYTFRLTVKDNRGAVGTDSVNVTVNPQVTTLSAPKETLRWYGTVSGANYGYSEYLPEGYVQKSTCPLIIFLHGLGETNQVNSSGADCNLSAVGKWGPLKYTRAGNKIPTIVLAPQNRTAYWSVDGVEAFRAFAVQKYKVDPSRVYLTGLSMGGCGTYAYANKYGQNLAAIMAMSPAGTLTTTGAQKLLTNHAGMWGDHCVDDGLVPISHTYNSYNNVGIDMGEAAAVVAPYFPSTTSLLTKTAHFDPTTKKWVYVDGQTPISGIPQFFMTIYNHGGHGGWQRMYEDPNFYTWAIKQYIH